MISPYFKVIKRPTLFASKWLKGKFAFGSSLQVMYYEFKNAFILTHRSSNFGNPNFLFTTLKSSIRVPHVLLKEFQSYFWKVKSIYKHKRGKNNLLQLN